MAFNNTVNRSEPVVETVTSEHKGSSSLVERKHPAFGMIGANRVQGHTQLYGSSIQHSGFISIVIKKSHEEIRNGYTHQFGDEIIAEVDVSETQWASFVSGMNIGSGVPCTLRYHRDGDMVYVPAIEDKSYEQKRSEEIALAVRKQAEQLKEAIAKFDELLQQPSIKKSELKELRSMFLHPVDYIESNTEFAAKLLNEHAERLVTDAKGEIEAYATRVAMQFPGLTQVLPKVTLNDEVKSLELRHDT